MARKTSIAALALFVIVSGLLTGGAYLVKRRSLADCGFCQRHIDPRSEVIAEIDGERRHVCCAHCALTEGIQEKKAVRIVSVTDYTSGRKIGPEHAWYVDGSRVIVCQHDMAHMRMDEMKQMPQESFDRCSPGTLAFANHSDADAFVASSGGAVLSFGEMVASMSAGGKQP
jgi:hypothetical protein